MDTKQYAIPDQLINDLYNAMLNLRASAMHHPRMDNILHATIEYAADSMQAIADLANEQHPAEGVAVQQVMREREAVAR